MTKIDFSQVVTCTTREAQRKEDWIMAVKAECSRRILAVLDERTMLNIQGAAIAAVLDPRDMARFRDAQAWVHNMRMVCRGAIETETEPEWPDLPVQIKDLAAQF